LSVPVLRRAKELVSGPLIWNAASLYGTTIVTSGLGYGYWFIAARLAPASSVGIASAAVSASQLIALVCVLGLSTLIIAELSTEKHQARSLILTAAVIVGVASLVLSVLVAIVLGLTSTDIKPAFAGIPRAGIFLLMSILTTVLVVLDNASVGLLRGDLQFKRNTIFGLVKLLLLPALIAADAAKSALPLEAAWLAGLALSAAALIRWLWKSTHGPEAPPARLQLAYFRERRRLMYGHYLLNLSAAAPGLAMPVIVAILLGASVNASYTAATLIAGFVNTIPFQLCTVLFALAPGDVVRLRIEMRKTLSISIGLGVAAVPFLFLFSHLVLSIFGSRYTSGTHTLELLGLGVFPSIVIAHYVAVARIRGRLKQAALWTTFGGAMEIGGGILGGKLFGITGVAAGVLIALAVQACFLAPGVIRSYKGNGPRGTGSEPQDLAPAL
jgi:O-antigen/teichoic acid export membrane protein